MESLQHKKRRGVVRQAHYYSYGIFTANERKNKKRPEYQPDNEGDGTCRRDEDAQEPGDRAPFTPLRIRRPRLSPDVNKNGKHKTPFTP